MASIQLQTLSQQGSSSATSSPVSPSTDRRSTRAAETSLPRTSVYSPRPSLQQQQRQQGPSQERRRLQTQATLEETPQTTQQLPAETQQEPQRTGTHPLLSLWSKIVKRLGPTVAVLALMLGIGMIAPTVGQYATGVWSAAKDYQDWCKGEQSVNHTLSDICELIVDRPLPPPPGLKQVFDISRRGTQSVATSFWDRQVDDWKAFLAFLHRPVGALFPMILIVLSMLGMGFNGKKTKLMIFSVSISMGYLTGGARIIFLFKTMFLLICFKVEPWFVFALGYVFLVTSWKFWIQDQGIKGLSWYEPIVLVIICFVRYTKGHFRTVRLCVRLSPIHTGPCRSLQS